MKTDKEIIDIDDTPGDDDRPQDVPQFKIEERGDLQNDRIGASIVPSAKKRGTLLVGILVSVVVALIILVVSLMLYHNAYPTDHRLKATISDEQNIALLKNPPSDSQRGTTVTSDSVLGVAFDMYSLAGLRASLEYEVPDTADNSLVLFMRSADYNPDGTVEGTLVMKGEKANVKSRDTRTGYMALSSDGTPVIGISQNDKVADRVAKINGSFFRQYPLLGDGELPLNFYLRGKVERGAIGRMADGKLYYVLTRHKETMYDFADALREYGFVDAIYLTGGNAYDFHRTPDGQPHISEAVKEKIAKYTSQSLPAPLLVFRAVE